MSFLSSLFGGFDMATFKPSLKMSARHLKLVRSLRRRPWRQVRETRARS